MFAAKLRRFQQSPESSFTSSKKTTDLSVNDGHSCDFIAESEPLSFRPSQQPDNRSLERGGEWHIMGWLDYQPRALKSAVLQSWLVKHTRDRGPPGLDIFTEENTVPIESIPDKYGHRTRAPSRIGVPQRSERTIEVDELSAKDLGSRDNMYATPSREERRERSRGRGPTKSGANSVPLGNRPSPTAEASRNLEHESGTPPVKHGWPARSGPPRRVG